MISIRKSFDRGLGDHGWLKSRHTFSFADYYDEAHMGFRDLRVINEDVIQGGTGFPTHGHRDMEIISYVLDGALEHEDSMGNKTVIRPGEVQRMSAGTGVAHSEYNAVKDKPTHFFQIWIRPNQRGLEPGYGQKTFTADLEKKELVLVVSNTGREGSIEIAQDADLYLSKPHKGDELAFELRPGRYAWLQLIRGSLEVNGERITSGDGLSATQVPALNIRALEDAEFMLFDLN